jgi:hypothetical protein
MGCVPGVVSVGLILVTPIPPTVRRDFARFSVTDRVLQRRGLVVGLPACGQRG